MTPIICFSCRYHGCSEYGEAQCLRIDDYPVVPCRYYKRRYEDDDEGI